MLDLLNASSSALNATSANRLSVCRILLQDYGCLRGIYPLPLDCAHAIGPAALAQSCPVDLERVFAQALVAPGAARVRVRLSAQAPT